jgi:predicted NAD-dependent protein-ADP-ribosyltransferase YbiA (DUF1768 family)
MPAVQSKLFATYPCDEVPTLRLDASILQKALADPDRKPMESFHNGAMPKFEKKVVGKLTLYLSPENLKKPEERMAFVTDGTFVWVFFGRMCLTNFAKATVHLGSGFSSECVEQLFQLMKCCHAVDQEASTNLEESLLQILNAAKPSVIKKTAGKVSGFMPSVWNSTSGKKDNTMSAKCMHSSILHACTVKETFLNYQSVFDQAPDTPIAQLIAEEKVCIMEVNDDIIWGSYKGYVTPLVDQLEAKAKDNEAFDLKASIDELCPGQNKLGLILTEFLLAIRTMKHEEFLQEIADAEIVFFEEVSKRQCSDSRTASVEEEVVGRTLTDARTPSSI